MMSRKRVETPMKKPKEIAKAVDDQPAITTLATCPQYVAVCAPSTKSELKQVIQ
jgi:hypothetical protein